MIHIAGLGMAGSYLLRRLTDNGFEVSAFDPRRPSYYLPCGYATNEELLDKYLSYVNMKAAGFVITRARSVTFSGNNFGEISFDSKGLCTIDKKRLEEDLISGVNYRSGRNGDESLLIDATGVSRALLGRHPGDVTMFAREYLTGKAKHEDFYFYFFKGGHGYFWEFPMGDRYHVGAGADNLEMIDKSLSGYDREIVTGRKIRLAPLFDRISKGNVIGVGEAIGTVSPISGEGIIPSIKSAEMLFQSLKKYGDIDRIVESYSSAVEKEFGYYRKLRRIVSRIQNGEKPGIGDIGSARHAKKDLENFGIDFRLSRVIGHFL